MTFHLDECEPAIRLKPCLYNVAKILEQGYQVVLSRVWSEVADITCCLPARGLVQNHVIGLTPLSWELMVAKGSGGRDTHGCHGLLLRDRRLTFLVCPVASNGSTAQPLSVHTGQSFLGITAVPESHESITSGTTRFHIPHDSSFRDGAKGGERLEQNFIIDFIAQIAHEDVKVARCVFLIIGVGLIGPVDLDLGMVNSSSVQSIHGAISRTGVIVLDEAVVQSFSLYLVMSVEARALPGITHVLVWNDLHRNDMACSLKDLSQDIFRNSCVQPSNI